MIFFYCWSNSKGEDSFRLKVQCEEFHEQEHEPEFYKTREYLKSHSQVDWSFRMDKEASYTRAPVQAVAGAAAPFLAELYFLVINLTTKTNRQTLRSIHHSYQNYNPNSANIFSQVWNSDNKEVILIYSYLARVFSIDYHTKLDKIKGEFARYDTWRNLSTITRTSTSSSHYLANSDHSSEMKQQKPSCYVYKQDNLHCLPFEQNENIKPHCIVTTLNAWTRRRNQFGALIHLAKLIKIVQSWTWSKIYLLAVFFSSSNIKRGERHPIASQGEILHEKLAPNMLFLELSIFPLLVSVRHSIANFFNLSNASVSPPTREALIIGFPSCIMKKAKYHQFQNIRLETYGDKISLKY